MNPWFNDQPMKATGHPLCFLAEAIRNVVRRRQISTLWPFSTPRAAIY